VDLNFAALRIALACLLLMLAPAAFAADETTSAPHSEAPEEDGTMGCAAGVPLHPQFKSYSERLEHDPQKCERFCDKIMLQHNE